MNDAEYFAARERAERELANHAPSAKVRDVHITLAEKYAALAAREAERAKNENEFSGQAQNVG